VDQLVFYSLLLSRAQPRPDLLRQLLTSVESLRRHGGRMPVVVFAWGDGTAAQVERLLAPYGVDVLAQGSYEERLARCCPQGWPFLAQYPLLHKFLNFGAIAALRPRQALFLDCDTLFFADVSRLFARYGEAHVYAREEPTCGRSHYGYDPGYLDEAALARLCAELGIAALPPFNLGAVLMNHGIWSVLADLEPTLIAYAWRLLLWMAANPSEQRAATYGEIGPVAAMRQRPPELASWAAAAPPLPYPSANQWILDQLALWLALGHLPGLSYGDFSPHHVVQNGELLSHPEPRPEWVLCHYFSQNMRRVEQWLRAPVAVDV
jgi:hypothetical protein